MDIYWERSHDPQSYSVQIQIRVSLGAGLADGEGGIVMFKDLDAGQTRSFEQNAPEQAGNVNSPVAWRRLELDGYVYYETPCWADSEPLYRLPEGYCIVGDPAVPDQPSIHHVRAK